MEKKKTNTSSNFITEHERAEDLLKTIFELELEERPVTAADLKTMVPMTRSGNSLLISKEAAMSKKTAIRAAFRFRKRERRMP